MFKNLISFKTLLWITSVILAVCSAAFSIFGLSKLFAGAAVSVIVMASTLEFAKLIAVTFIHNYYSQIKIGMRTYLLSATVILMIITSMGVYGFLTNAYQLALKSYSENAINSEFIIKNKELLSKEISYLEKQQNDLTQRLQSYDKIRIEQEGSILNNKTKVNIQKNIKSTTKITDDISRKIDEISAKKNKLSDSLMTLEKRVLNIELENNQTELGPLIYISRITGYQMDFIVNIFVLIITLVFDPLAIALLLAANFLSKLEIKNKNQEVIENTEIEVPEIAVSPNQPASKIDLESSEKITILDDDQITKPVENNTEDSNDQISDEDKFYGTSNESFNKHPWKVGF
jgi:hypothetical protein